MRHPEKPITMTKIPEYSTYSFTHIIKLALFRKKTLFPQRYKISGLNIRAGRLRSRPFLIALFSTISVKIQIYKSLVIS